MFFKYIKIFNFGKTSIFALKCPHVIYGTLDVLCGLIYVALFIWNVDIDQLKGQEAKATGPNLQLVAYVCGNLVLFCQSVVIVSFTQSHNTCYPYDIPCETSYSYYSTQPSQML